MARGDNDARADFMERHGLCTAAWNEDGELISASRFAPPPPPKVTPPAAPQGPAAKLAEAFQQRLKREHETRFAASHFKPRLDVPVATDQVPRAVRDREAASGNRAPNKSKRR